MDGEIILNRNDTNVMKLDDNEQALMDEIEITVPRPQPVKKQMPKRMATQFTPPETQTFQEDIDSFANPDKQTRPLLHHQKNPLITESTMMWVNPNQRMNTAVVDTRKRNHRPGIKQ